LIQLLDISSNISIIDIPDSDIKSSRDMTSVRWLCRIMNKKIDLLIEDEIDEISHSTLQTLPPPMSLEKVIQWQSVNWETQPDFLKHSYIKDGILVRGIDVKDQGQANTFSNLIKECLAAINKVEDEHFKSLGLIAAGFLRFLIVEIEILKSKKWNIQLKFFFRFTTNECPAGLRMIRKVRLALEEVFLGKQNLPIKQFVIACYHGGTDWSLDDIHDKAQRQVLSELLAIKNTEDIYSLPLVFQ
jgi:hypothetical protein